MSLSKELHEKFLNVSCALSPENLTCDGELSRAEVDRRLRELQAEWNKLEAEAGRKVTEDEVWAQFYKSRR